MSANENPSKFEKVIELTRQLVKINSENPINNEYAVQKYIEKILQSMKFEYEILPYESRRNNIIARFPPLKDASNCNNEYIMFSGHMDTVPGYKETLSGEAPIKDGKLYGRGACDMKGGLGAILAAVSEFLNDYAPNNTISKLKKGICLLFTVDEEMGCSGAHALKNYDKIGKDFSIEFGINAEPSHLYPAIGHKGIVWFILDFKGKAAHASTPFLGENAIEKAATLILNLEDLKKELSNRYVPEFPEITPPTLNVGIINGGNKTNIVPEQCHVEIDRRLIPTETSESALEEINKIIKKLGFEDDVLISPVKPGESYLIPDGSKNKYYREILEICKDYNAEGKLFMDGYTEADVYYRFFGIPVLNLGPGSVDQAHKSDEYVEIDQLLKCSEIFYKILEKYALKE